MPLPAIPYFPATLFSVTAILHLWNYPFTVGYLALQASYSFQIYSLSILRVQWCEY